MKLNTKKEKKGLLKATKEKMVDKGMIVQRFKVSVATLADLN